MGLDDVDALRREYVGEALAGRAEAGGWGDWINVPSKVAQVAATKVFARDFAAEARARDVLVNAVCPGLVDTEASRPWFADVSRVKSPDDAAARAQARPSRPGRPAKRGRERGRRGPQLAAVAARGTLH